MASNEAREGRHDAEIVRRWTSNLARPIAHTPMGAAERLADAYLAVLNDPTVLLAEPEWEEAGGCLLWWSIVGLYKVFQSSDESDRWCYWQLTDHEMSEVNSPDEAKAACFADFRQRIRSCFQPKENHDDPR